MEREIKGIWIPIEIWEASDLSWNEKILLMEIDSFTSREKDCYFSNDYIAEMLHIKADTASKMVSSLIRKGYIRQVRFDGRKRYLASCIEVRCGVGLKSEADYDENHTQPRRNIIDNNISNKPGNNKSSNEEYISINPLPPTEFSFRAALLSLGVSKEVTDAWLKVRKTKKAVNSKIAFEDVAKELRLAQQAGHSADECIKFAVVKSWAGFKWEWMEDCSTRSSRSASGAERNTGKTAVDRLLALGETMFGEPQKPSYDEQ